MTTGMCQSGSRTRSADFGAGRGENGIDCGIFVIENGLALMAGDLRAEGFNAFAGRRRLAHELWATAVRYNPPGRVQVARRMDSPARGIETCGKPKVL